MPKNKFVNVMKIRKMLMLLKQMLKLRVLKSDQSQVAEAQQTEAVVSQQVQAQATYTAPAETTSATISNTASTPSNTNASASVTTPVTPIPTVSNDQKWTNQDISERLILREVQS